MNSLIDDLESLDDPVEQQQLLTEYIEASSSMLDATFDTDELAANLKQRADLLLRAGHMQRAEQMAALLTHLAALTGNQTYHALGLRAQANIACIGHAEYARTVALCDQAAAIYRSHHLAVEEATAQIIKVTAIARAGDFERAFKLGEQIRQVFYTHQQWYSFASITADIAIGLARQGRDAQALALFEEAEEYLDRDGADHEGVRAWISGNKVVQLCNLGRFDEAIQVAQETWQTLERLSLHIPAARTQQALANTYAMLGRYNEALQLFEKSRDIFASDDRLRDALVVDLFMSDVLLQLHRYYDVLDKSQKIHDVFAELEAQMEIAQAVLNEAIAHKGLSQFQEAMTCLTKARQMFEQYQSPQWMRVVDLEIAILLYMSQQFEQSLITALSCRLAFQQGGQRAKEAYADLIAARSYLGLGQLELAQALIDRVLEIGNEHDLPSILYQSYHLAGRIAEQKQENRAAQAYYRQSIEQIERLRRRLMVELRVDFQQDKDDIYADMVRICIAQQQPQDGLLYAERAKSRALVDLLAYRLDLNIRVRSREDMVLIDELEAQQSLRNQLYRRWENDQAAKSNMPKTADDAASDGNGSYEQDYEDKTRLEILRLEKQITELRNKLLIRNADYARDIGLQQVHTERIQPHIPDETVLVEYFVVQNQLYVFVVDADSTHAYTLSGTLAQIQQTLQFLRLNINAVPKQSANRATTSIKNAQKLLQKLYRILIEPIESLLSSYKRLIVVPHGVLHYLPFHSLFDGQRYLIERYEISHLPGASILGYLRKSSTAPNQPSCEHRLGAFGYSNDGMLPNISEEIATICQYISGDSFLEEQATITQLEQVVSSYDILHLATHGDFRPDNPLFSGLTLADGPLTTLKIFGLQLSASLVTLSACQTGRSVVGAGDELLGLTRAFLYAGASSLVLSLWPVEDQSTAILMSLFYQALAQGYTKSAALRQAQLHFIHAEDKPFHRHPYFWSPFFLVGDADKL
ncbi:MAG: CHAT domain-containing tetratricopeptide repeat protein [Chloroflexota bacterium]